MAANRPASKPRPPQVASLRERLLAIAEREGKTLAAINAGLFAGRLSDQLAARIAAARRDLAARVIRQYCIAKGVAVALNPIPVADLLAAAGWMRPWSCTLARLRPAADAARSGPPGRHDLRTARRAHGRDLGRAAGVFGAEGAQRRPVDGGHRRRPGCAGLVRHGTDRPRRRGIPGQRQIWGEHGAKRAVADIVAGLDRDSILREAREEILKRLRKRG